MQPKKSWLRTFSLLVVAALLVACASPAAAPTATPVPPTSTPVPSTTHARSGDGDTPARNINASTAIAG